MGTDLTPSTRTHVFINQIHPGMKNINATFIILEIGSPQRNPQGSEVRSVRIADQTGSINLCLWNEQGENIVAKKVYTLRNGFASIIKGRLSLSLARSGELSKTESGQMSYVELPDMSAYNPENSLKRGANFSDEKDVDIIGKRSCKEDLSLQNHVNISQLVPGMKNIYTNFVILDIPPPRKTSQGHEVRAVKVADSSGSVVLNVWNELGDTISVGNTVYRLKNGYTNVHKGSLSLSISRPTDLCKTNEVYELTVREKPDMSAYNLEFDAIRGSAKSSVHDSGDDSNGRKHITEQSNNKHIYIQQLQPNMKNINSIFIVLEVGASRSTPHGDEVRTIRVADQSGSILMPVWNDFAEFVSSGDILRLRNGITTIHKGCLNLTAGKFGELLKTGEFLMAFSELPDLSVYNPEFDKTFQPMSSNNSSEISTLNGHSSSILSVGTGPKTPVVGGNLITPGMTYSSSGILQK